MLAKYGRGSISLQSPGAYQFEMVYNRYTHTYVLLFLEIRLIYRLCCTIYKFMDWVTIYSLTPIYNTDIMRSILHVQSTDSAIHRLCKDL